MLKNASMPSLPKDDMKLSYEGMRVCMYVCMYVCKYMYVCMHVCDILVLDASWNKFSKGEVTISAKHGG